MPAFSWGCSSRLRIQTGKRRSQPCELPHLWTAHARLCCGTPADAFIGDRGHLGPLWFGIFGLSLILSGLFVDAPNTPQSIIHGLVGIVVFSALPLASFGLAWRFAGDSAWRGWVLCSLAVGIVVLGMFIVTSVVSSLDQKGALVGAPIGLLQRGVIIVGWSWVALLALRLLGL